MIDSGYFYSSGHWFSGSNPSLDDFFFQFKFFLCSEFELSLYILSHLYSHYKIVIFYIKRLATSLVMK